MLNLGMIHFNKTLGYSFAQQKCPGGLVNGRLQSESWGNVSGKTHSSFPKHLLTKCPWAEPISVSKKLIRGRILSYSCNVQLPVLMSCRYMALSVFFWNNMCWIKVNIFVTYNGMWRTCETNSVTSPWSCMPAGESKILGKMCFSVYVVLLSSW